ncbi:MAG: serine acetyltransferase [Chlorobium sp.]|uniref:serine O-acetyltransferase n=1 Tax=Chlorobium sp. TaxID=1095 RepID=UPI0025C6B46B|nr:serine acetyltransferase [Chlorobium sp.]MCF8383074.1 serine acetyltransferase [Chlorobium sp.]
MISATEPDWNRENIVPGRYEPAKYLMAAVRSYQHAAKRGGIIGKLAKPFHVMRHRFWSAVSGADIPVNSRIGGGLLMPHPNGIVVHPDAEIGPNCLIFQQVTIGTGGPKAGTPRIGGHVDIGAGAKILGGVTIGSHARIGANAVVIDDIPENATAAGIPAKIVSKEKTP